MKQDNQQERLIILLIRILTGHTSEVEISTKIWSDPHSDMGSCAKQEMTQL
jgi:hypothetical protein